MAGERQRIAACSCGQLRATASGEPVRVSVCHCLNCQRRSGSVFATQARFARDAVTLAGESTEYVRTGDSGGQAAFHFCPRCGDTVYYRPLAMPGFIVIPVGAFADPSFPAPEISVYDERMHAWVRMPDDIEHMA